MNMEFLQDLFSLCIVPLLAICVKYFIQYLELKGNEIIGNIDNNIAAKYVTMLKDTIVDCVEATNQTYVEALKDANAFTEEAQKIAFQKTFDAVIEILSDDAKEYLTEIYGDLNKYISQKIEAEVTKAKINK